MSSPAALSGFVFFILLRHVVPSQSGWRVTYSPDKVCAEEGATVELTCTYTYPSSNRYRVIKSFWFIRERNKEPLDLKDDPQFANRVSYSDGNCRVRITNVRKSDAAVYKFRFITDQRGGKYTGEGGVTLSLRDLQVKAEGSQFSKWVTVTCVGSCPPQHASYIWYKDGQKIPATTTNFRTELYDHSYSCAFKGSESFPSAPACGYYSKCNKVMYTDRSICAPLGSSVDISCTHDGHEVITSRFWFCPEHGNRPEDLSKHSQYTGRVQVSDDQRGRYTLKITDLRERDSAEYRFKFTTSRIVWGNDLHGTTLTVTDLQVQVKRIKAYQSYTEVELKCLCSCSEAERLSYIWFKNSEKIPGADKSTYQSSFSHEDKISCALHGHDRFPSPSVYAPKTPTVQFNTSAAILESSFVTLTCSTDANPAANFTWFKKNESGDFKPFSNEEQLIFSFVKLSDAGEYRCSVENEFSMKKSEPVIIDVKYAPKTPSVSLSPSGKVIEGRSVTLTCSTDANPAANFTWFKKNESGDFKPFSNEEQLIFSSVKISDAGEYRCSAENEFSQKTSKLIIIDVKYAPKTPSVSLSPSGNIIEGGSVTLTCSSDANPAANFTWFKKNESGDFKPFSNEEQHVFSSVKVSDAGEYRCSVENEFSQKTSKLIIIDVKYAPKTPSVQLNAPTVILQNSVTLTCSSDANPAANFTWFKKNESGDFKPFSNEEQIIFSSVKLSDAGEYRCSAENEFSQKTSKLIIIDVKYAPKPPSVSLSPSGKVIEGRSVTLTCSADANPPATYTWYKINQTAPQEIQGLYHFNNISSEDSGMYFCTSKNDYGQINSSAVFIDVLYSPRPPNVSQSPSVEIMEDSTVDLNCSSDANPAANYTWYKINRDTPVAFGQTFTIRDIKADHSGSYYCQAHNSIGHSNSTLCSVVVLASMKSVAVGSVTAVVLVLIVLLIILLYVSKKRSSKETNITRERAEIQQQVINENPSDSARRQPAAEQDLIYASVRFSNNQGDPVYSNPVKAKSKRPKMKEEDDDDVQYSVVNFKRGGDTSQSRYQAALEDASALYSTVVRKPRV